MSATSEDISMYRVGGHLVPKSGNLVHFVTYGHAPLLDRTAERFVGMMRNIEKDVGICALRHQRHTVGTPSSLLRSGPFPSYVSPMRGALRALLRQSTRVPSGARTGAVSSCAEYSGVFLHQSTCIPHGTRLG